MHAKTDCKHFVWKKGLLVDGIKMDKNILWEPHCHLNKLTKLLNCPKDCKWFENG